MSSIGPTPPGLGAPGFDPAGQVTLDQARQHELLRADAGAGAAVAEAAPAALVDPGEAVLGLAAWDGAEAPHALPRDAGLTARLAMMDRADAANAGVDAIVSAL